MEATTDRTSGGPRRPPWLLVVVAAVALVIAGVTFALTRKDDSTKVATPPESSSSSADAGPPAFAGIPVWPIDGTTFDSAEAVAKSFASDYLGIASPIAQVDGNDVVVQPNGKGAKTTVQTAQTKHGWVVLGATSDQVTIDGVAPTSRVPTVTGVSTATEATVSVQARPFGTATPTATQTTNGGANGTMGPYSTGIDAPAAGVIVVGVPDLSGRGTFTAAAVKRYVLGVGFTTIADGSIFGRTPDGTFQAVTSGAGAPATSDDVIGLQAPVDDGTATALQTLGTLPTWLPSGHVALVEANGKTVDDVDIIGGTMTKRFTAMNAIKTLDANAAGGLLFTDDQTGLWRWDGPGQGPVQMTTGYVDAAW